MMTACTKQPQYRWTDEPTNQFNRLIEIRAPEFLTKALDNAADQRLTSRSDHIRTALLERLRAVGKKSGWDVAKHAREIDPKIAVIYVTGHGADDWTYHGLPKSILITKPFCGCPALDGSFRICSMAALSRVSRLSRWPPA